MVFDGVNSQGEPRGDLLIRQPLFEQCEYFHLPRSQCAVRRIGEGISADLGIHVAKQHRRCFRRAVVVAVGNRMNDVKEMIERFGS